MLGQLDVKSNALVNGGEEFSVSDPQEICHFDSEFSGYLKKFSFLWKSVSQLFAKCCLASVFTFFVLFDNNYKCYKGPFSWIFCKIAVIVTLIFSEKSEDN